jgi:putative membrane protein
MKKYYLLLSLFFIGLIVSAIQPHDYFTWILEVAPALIGFIVLVLTFKQFRFTYFSYILILIHCYVLFIGGHYTYAEVPLFNYIKDWLHESRNNYDKVGHFVQGFIPAFLIREFFIRKQIVKNKGWISFLTICFCVTISAFYELIEWIITLISGASSEAFLGIQGYIWDTQADILFALIGAVIMILFFTKLHDKQINKLQWTN